jgi:hypothetical protein
MGGAVGPATRRRSRAPPPAASRCPWLAGLSDALPTATSAASPSSAHRSRRPCPRRPSHHRRQHGFGTRVRDVYAQDPAAGQRHASGAGQCPGSRHPLSRRDCAKGRLPLCPRKYGLSSATGTSYHGRLAFRASAASQSVERRGLVLRWDIRPDGSYLEMRYRPCVVLGRFILQDRHFGTVGELAAPNPCRLRSVVPSKGAGTTLVIREDENRLLI